MNPNEQMIARLAVSNFMNSVRRYCVDYIFTSRSLWEDRKAAIVNALDQLFIPLSDARSDLERMNLLTEFYNQNRSNWSHNASLSEPVDAVLAYIAEKFITDPGDQIIAMYLINTIYRYRREYGSNRVEAMIEALRNAPQYEASAVIVDQASRVTQTGMFAENGRINIADVSTSITHSNRERLLTQ